MTGAANTLQQSFPRAMPFVWARILRITATSVFGLEYGSHLGNGMPWPRLLPVALVGVVLVALGLPGLGNRQPGEPLR